LVYNCDDSQTETSGDEQEEDYTEQQFQWRRKYQQSWVSQLIFLYTP